jgi:hypothetical protein
MSIKAAPPPGGLHKDDIIIGLNRERVCSIAELRKVLESKPTVIALNVIAAKASICCCVNSPSGHRVQCDVRTRRVMLRLSIHQRYLHHAWKVLRSILIGLIVGGLLLAVMPSLRQWQLSPTTQYDSADESPPAIIPPFAAPPRGRERL